MLNKELDWNQYCSVARKAVAEGCVLLKNDNEALPLKRGTKVAVFGRMQNNYYKSGTGSGGLVNVTRVISIMDGLMDCEEIILNEELIKVYQQWELEHPFDRGIGWGNEPWSQEEMPLSAELVQNTAKESSHAIVILARTAGEDQDNHDTEGSYRLTKAEEDMLFQVGQSFEKVTVVLNVGNIIDMSFVDNFKIDAILYAWQGGMVGGAGVADVLVGRTYPSGKLTDTIAYSIQDYPSDSNFGDFKRNIYVEDIYVGYRYFETVAKEKVRYPFGYGLTYTEFAINVLNFTRNEFKVQIEVEVKNTGRYPGKEVVQLYLEAPQGLMGKPLRSLVGYQKTQELKPSDAQRLYFTMDIKEFASYDDSGVTGHKSSFVLEAGEYKLYAGNSVRELNSAGSFHLEKLIVVNTTEEAMAPELKYQRMKPAKSELGTYLMQQEEVPSATIDSEKRRIKNLPREISYTEDRGFTLWDVKEGKASMEEFIGQLSDEDLSCIIRGEGMGSPKVTPGTAAAFGGISDNLKAYGIPCGCCSDGPSGMRMDCGTKAFSLPNGTLLASTFNEELLEELYTYMGIEMVKNKIDTLLGPGMNIHRHPLNGRNFEYFSEDPLVTGRMAAAQLRGMHKSGVTGTIKHFCGNNQETKRHESESVISERALREIYLKGFEIAVKEGNASSIMTTYGSVNGLWTAGNNDLNTQILRNEWGFQGIVMTDWWANINEKGKPENKTNFAAMARSQNDLYMVCPDASVNTIGDNTLEALENGTLTRGELQRNAINICSFLLHTHALERMNGIESQIELVNCADEEEALQNKEVVYYQVQDQTVVPLEEVNTEQGASYALGFDLEQIGFYKLELVGKSDLGELAQMVITIFVEGTAVAAFTWNGTCGEWISKSQRIEVKSKYIAVRLYFGQSGVDLKELRLIRE